MIQLKRILLPTDFSDLCWFAAGYACELAKRFDSQLHLVHVLESPIAAMPSPGAILPESFLEHVEDDAAKQLKEWHASELDAACPVVRVMERGTPFVEIVRYANQHDIDLIVLGTHGRTGLTHLLIGSVAERVVRKAGCPVLTVRPEGHQFVMP